MVARAICPPSVENRDLSVESDRGPGYQRFCAANAGSIDRVARCKVVAAVQDDRCGSDFSIEPLAVQTRLQRDHIDVRIDQVKGIAARFDLRSPDRRGVVENLSLQVGQVNGIAIANAIVPIPAAAR